MGKIAIKSPFNSDGSLNEPSNYDIPTPREVVVYKELPVEIIKEVEKIIYVDKPVEVIKEIPVEKIIYIDKPIEVIKETEKLIYIDKPVEVIKEITIEKSVDVIKEKIINKIPTWVYLAMASELAAIVFLLIK